MDHFVCICHSFKSKHRQGSVKLSATNCSTAHLEFYIIVNITRFFTKE
ncbi:hypothetical protein ACU8KH_03470 [Lachancea thermotolerans]